MERALKSHGSELRRKTAMRDQFHYSQLSGGLWARRVDIEQTRIQVDTLREPFEATWREMCARGVNFFDLIQLWMGIKQ
jgi:hypothetical protein